MEIAGFDGALVPGEERLRTLFDAAVGALLEPGLPGIVGDGGQPSPELVEVALLELQPVHPDGVADVRAGHAVGLQLQGDGEVVAHADATAQFTS